VRARRWCPTRFPRCKLPAFRSPNTWPFSRQQGVQQHPGVVELACVDKSTLHLPASVLRQVLLIRRLPVRGHSPTFELMSRRTSRISRRIFLVCSSWDGHHPMRIANILSNSMQTGATKAPTQAATRAAVILTSIITQILGVMKMRICIESIVRAWKLSKEVEREEREERSRSCT
jgi:hypothetical protein